MEKNITLILVKTKLAIRMKLFYFSVFFLCIMYNAEAQDFTQVGPLTSANSGVTTVDLNKDSFPDIVFLKRERFTNRNNKLIREINDAGATLSFTELALTTTNEIFGTPAAADFDQDGDTDIVFSGENEGTLLLFQGEAGDSLTETVLAIRGAGQFTVANLNGDEFPDLVGLSFIDEEVVAYLNTNGAGFTGGSNDLRHGDRAVCLPCRGHRW